MKFTLKLTLRVPRKYLLSTIIIKPIKAHRYVKSGVGAVLLVRNPYEAIMSEFNRKRGHGHTSHASVKAGFEIFPLSTCRGDYNSYRGGGVCKHTLAGVYIGVSISS